MSTHDEREAAMLQWRKLVQADKEELGDFPRFTVHPLVVTEDENESVPHVCSRRNRPGPDFQNQRPV